MTITKRIFAFIMTLVLMAGLVTGAAAMSFRDDEDIRNSEAVFMLTELEVVSGFPDGTFRPDEYVTREQAAKMISTILRRKDDSFAWDGSFTFSDQSGWANEAIEYCSFKGIIAGYSDGTFDPEGYITADQMAKMLLVAVGFDPEPYTGESWLENVNQDAWSVGIFDNFAGSTVDPLTRDNACLLIFNALKCQAISGYSNGEPEYYLDELMNPMTVLEYYFDVKMYTEVVTGNEFADLTTTDSRLEQGMTKIAGHKEFAISTGMEYLGRQINIYISADGEIVGQPVFSEKDLVMTFDNGDEFDSFYDLGKVLLDDSTEFYLNYNEATFAVIGLLDENTSVTVIDRDGDDIIDVMMVTQCHQVTITGESDQGWLIDDSEFMNGVLAYGMVSGRRLEVGKTVKLAYIGGVVRIME